MASKRARKKNKSIKQEKQKQRELEEKKNKFLKYTGIFLATIILVFLIYLWISNINSPGYVPSSDVGASIGPEDAEVVVLEFGCFTCPFTQQFNQNVMPALIEEYSDRVKFVFRSSPIYSNPGAELSSIAGKCADQQGDFWSYAEDLFSAQSFNEATVLNLAEQNGLDVGEFENCLADDSMADLVRDDYDAARRARITVTPTLFVNDVRINGAVDIGSLRRLLDDKLEKYE